MRSVPERFRAFVTLPLNNTMEAAVEPRRTARELGFVGSIISGLPQTGNVFLDDKMYYPIWEALCAEDSHLFLPEKNEIYGIQ